jgi:hypothetical protein
MPSAGTVTGSLGRLGATFVLALMLAACSSKSDYADKTAGKAVNAALTPAEDIGIKRDEIPEELKKLVENPYFTPKPLRCKTIKEELAGLNELLGTDMDMPKVALKDGESYAETGADMIQEGIVGLVRSYTNIIPYRSIVRSLTGAKSHEKALVKAREAGKLRRAYLKGLASAKFGTSCKLSPEIVTADAKGTLSEKLESLSK